MQANKNIIEAAISKDPTAIKYSTDATEGCKALAMKCLEKDAELYWNLPKEVQKDTEILRFCSRKSVYSEFSLEFLDQNIRSNKDIVLSVVKK